jgi:hypothetical protein
MVLKRYSARRPGASALMPLVFLACIDLVAQSPKTPVLVELFTSEGCSSCPPADALLAQLEKSQPVAGVEIIALGEHVDYWDRLGWRDPFSSPEFTARQNQYSRMLHNDNIYTPQIIVDGRIECAGNDARRAQQEIAIAARAAKVPVQLTIRQSAAPAGTAPLAIHVENSPAGAEVLLAITETNLHSGVLKGENKGRTLHHTAVVRKLAVIGRVKSKQSFSAEPLVEIQKSWNAQNLRAVAFLEDRSTHRILGAAEIPLSPAAPITAGN